MSDIHATDVHAALQHAPAAGARAARRCRSILDDARAFATYEELLRACPPERLGISPGAYAAALAPLFGEFE